MITACKEQKVLSQRKVLKTLKTYYKSKPKTLKQNNYKNQKA
jgi:hypothetical protein